MKAVIIGRNGQVARELQQEVMQEVELLVLGSSDIDILNFELLRNTIFQFNPDVIINASAYTAVDKAETDVDAAYAINETAVKYLAKIAKGLRCRLLHISTDFVFDGEKNTAYEVNDKTNPLGIYGESKLAGEKAIQTIYPENSVIVRTSWVYSSHGNNFVKTMLRLMSEKEELNVVADQIGCPTCAKGLAQFLWLLAKEAKVEQIYHWSDLGVASWYDFAVQIQNEALRHSLLSKRIPIYPIESKDYSTAAKRPTFSLLLSQNKFAEQIHWSDALREIIQDIKGNK